MSTHADDAAASAAVQRLAWPPPGLERLHGAMAPLARRLLWGALWLALPLLIAVATEQPFNQLGPYGRGWWFPLFTTTVGTVMLANAALQIARLLHEVQRANRLGYGARVVLFAASDHEGVGGQVLQGQRIYQFLEPKHRDALMFAHATAQVAWVLAGLWIPIGLALAFVMASAGLVGNLAMWVITLAPALILALVGSFAHAAEGSLLKQAKRTAPEPRELQNNLVREARTWQSALAELRGDDPHAFTPPSPKRVLSLAPLLAIALTAAAALPLFKLLPAFAMGPVPAGRSEPSYQLMQKQYESFGVLAGFRTQLDSSITAEQAGLAFASIGGARASFRGVDDYDNMLGVNLRAVAGSPLGHEFSWPDSLVTKAVRGSLTAAQRAMIDTLDFTKLNAAIATLARAPAIDINHVRGNLPGSDTVPLAYTRWWFMGGLQRVGAAATLASVQAVTHGRMEEGEAILRNLVSAGLHIMESGSSVGDFRAGRQLTLIGARGLRSMMSATGRSEHAETLAEVARTPEGPHLEVRSGDFAEQLAAAPRWVLDESKLRSLRWHRFATLQTVVPCLNYHAAVFPTDKAHQKWLDDARIALVRLPSDSALFDRAKRGEWVNPAVAGDECRTPLPMREWVSAIF